MWKLVTIPVIIRRNPNNAQEIQVHTQTRKVIDKAYDPLYDGTQETCGETVEGGESIIDAIVRGVQEEMGARMEQVVIQIIGAGGKRIQHADHRAHTLSTRPEDEMLSLEPFGFIQQLKGPQPWVGPVFVVEVRSDFEPQLDEEGEVSAHRWWTPLELAEVLRTTPIAFMGLHYPALLSVCEDLLDPNGTIRPLISD